MIGFQENRELLVEDGKLTGGSPNRSCAPPNWRRLTIGFDLGTIETLVVGDGNNDLAMISAPASASPTTQTRRRRRRQRGSITATSPRCFMRRVSAG